MCYDYCMENNITTTYHNGIEVSSSRNHWQARPSRTKLYVSYDFADRLIGPYPDGPKCRDVNCGSATCKVQRDQHASYWCEVDHKVWRRHHLAALKAVKAVVIPALADHFGVPVDQLKLRFSSKAGCSCGCSPGFYVDGSGTFNRSVNVGWAVDVHPWKILGRLGAEARSLVRG